MGYKVLDPTKTFAEQMTAENTIYEIRDVFDLNGGNITIPADCTLKFNGGGINNGKISAAENSSYNINYISGKGIMCELDNDFNQVYASWFGINESSLPQYNMERLQMICNLYSKENISYLKYGMPMLVIDVPLIKVSRSVLVPRNLCITSSFDTALINGSYPIIDFIGDDEESDEYNSGFLYNVEYSSGNDVSNICIKSKSHCINFENEASEIHATVYYSKFKNLILFSENGSCIYKKTGGASIFSCTFENIDGNCPNGSVIDGAFSGLNLIYDNIRVLGQDVTNPKLGTKCANSVFNNCCGIIQNCNVGDKNIGGFVTFDGNLKSLGKRIYIRHCNIEQINGGIVVCANDITNFSINISIENTSILYYITEERGFPNGVDFDIIHVKDLNSIDFTNVILPSTMASGYYRVKTWGCSASVKTSGNIDYSIYANSASYGSVYATFYHRPFTITQKYISGQNCNVQSIRDFEVGENFFINGTNIGTMLLVSGTTNSFNPANGGNPKVGLYDILNLVTPANIDNRTLELYSNPTKEKVKIINTSDSKYFELNINGFLYKINPGKDLVVKIIDNTIVALSEDGSYGIATTSGRPSIAPIGFKLFDIDLGKYICYNGTSWVNLDGTPLS